MTDLKAINANFVQIGNTVLPTGRIIPIADGDNLEIRLAGGGILIPKCPYSQYSTGGVPFDSISDLQSWLASNAAKNPLINVRLAIAAGYTVDEQTFNDAVAADLPYSYQREATCILAPGITKNGGIAGVDNAGNTVPFTFGAPGIRNYIDKNGLLQTAAANVARIDYSTGAAGYLMESASTNLCPWSTDFTKWIPSQISIALKSTLTSTGRPFYEISKTDTNPNAAIRFSPSVTAANTSYYFRITLRAGTKTSCAIGVGPYADSADGSGGNLWGTPGNTIKIISGPGSIASYTGSLTSVTGLSTTQDTVVVISRAYVSAGINTAASIYPDISSSTVLGASILVSTAQLEANKISSQIDTSGAIATRVTDLLHSTTDIIPYNAASIYMDVVTTSIGAGSTNLVAAKNGGGFRFPYTQDDKIYTISDNTTQSGLTVTNSKMLSYYGVTSKNFANGGVVSSPSAVNATKIPGSGPTTLGAGAGWASNIYRTIAIIPRTLSDAEAQTLTT